MKNNKIALIDIGSNSIRLVIFQINENGFYKEIQNLKIVARLSSHLDDKSILSNEGILKLTESLQHFNAVINTFDINKVKCVATAAIRQAKNQELILAEVKRKTNFSIRVLSEYEEAFYGFLAVANSTNIENGITIDIGGGSTEVTLFKNRQLIHYHSFPFGAITLKKKFYKNEIITENEQIDLKTFLLNQFQSLEWLKNIQKLPLIGIGGSARNLSLIQQRKVDYPLRGLHQFEIDLNDVKKTNSQLVKMNLKERQLVEGLSKDRTDIISPALEAFCSLMEVAKISTFIMSNKGLRDGLFYEELFLQLNIDRFSNVVNESFYQLIHEYGINANDIKYLSEIVTKLFYELESLNIPLSKEDLRLLQLSCRVLYIGELISREASSENTFYLLTNRTIDGLSHIERVQIALISSFKSKSVFNCYLKNYKSWFTKDDISKLELLGGMLKFCYALNKTRRHIITDIKIVETFEHEFKLKLFSDVEPYFEKVQAEKYKKHLERPLKKQIQLLFARFQ